MGSADISHFSLLIHISEGKKQFIPLNNKLYKKRSWKCSNTESRNSVENLMDGDPLDYGF